MARRARVSEPSSDVCFARSPRAWHEREKTMGVLSPSFECLQPCHNVVHPPPTAENEYSTHKVIPNFRDAAAAALGERWACTLPGWFEPGGDKPLFFTPNNDDTSSGMGDDGENDGRSLRARSLAYSRATAAPSTTPGSRETSEVASQAAAAGSRGAAAPLPTTPPTGSVKEVATPPTPGSGVVSAGRTGGANSASRRVGSMAPYSEPLSGDGGTGDGGGGSSSARLGRESDTSSKPRPFTTERNNAKDLAQYLGVSGPDNGNGSGGIGGGARKIRGGGKKGVEGLTLGPMEEQEERDKGNDEDQVRGRRQGDRCF